MQIILSHPVAPLELLLGPLVLYCILPGSLYNVCFAHFAGLFACAPMSSTENMWEICFFFTNIYCSAAHRSCLILGGFPVPTTFKSQTKTACLV